MPTPGRNRGIEKVDVETDMQKAVAGFNAIDDATDRDREAVFIQPPHVDHVDPAVLQEPPFARVDRANAEQMQPRRIDQSVRLAPKHGFETRLATSIAERMPCIFPDGEVNGVLKSE